MSNIKAGDYIRMKNNADAMFHMNWRSYCDNQYKVLAVFDKDYSSYGSVLIEYNGHNAWYLKSCPWYNIFNIHMLLSDIERDNPGIRCWWVHEDMIELADKPNDCCIINEDNAGLNYL